MLVLPVLLAMSEEGIVPETAPPVMPRMVSAVLPMDRREPAEKMARQLSGMTWPVKPIWSSPRSRKRFPFQLLAVLWMRTRGPPVRVPSGFAPVRTRTFPVPLMAGWKFQRRVVPPAVFDEFSR